VTDLVKDPNIIALRVQYMNGEEIITMNATMPMDEVKRLRKMKMTPELDIIEGMIQGFEAAHWFKAT
jgi:hypothetical protein